VHCAWSMDPALAAVRAQALRELAARVGYAARKAKVLSESSRTRFLAPLYEVLDDIGDELHHLSSTCANPLDSAPIYVSTEISILHSLASRSMSTAAEHGLVSPAAPQYNIFSSSEVGDDLSDGSMDRWLLDEPLSTSVEVQTEVPLASDELLRDQIRFLEVKVSAIVDHSDVVDGLGCGLVANEPLDWLILYDAEGFPLNVEIVSHFSDDDDDWSVFQSLYPNQPSTAPPYIPVATTGELDRTSTRIANQLGIPMNGWIGESLVFARPTPATSAPEAPMIGKGNVLGCRLSHVNSTFGKYYCGQCDQPDALGTTVLQVGCRLYCIHCRSASRMKIGCRVCESVFCIACAPKAFNKRRSCIDAGTIELDWIRNPLLR
jgi:hypothetical protein